VVSLSGGEFDGWDEELLKRFGELLRVARERDELRHYVRIRSLRSPTAKLIYEFLRSHQPQTILSIRHVLGVKRNTAPAAMRELVDKGYVVVDDQFFYWVAPFEGKP
jgi:Fic family protein